MSAPRWLSALMLALALVAGAALMLQQQSANQLRDEIALLQDENRELARLRAENARLAAAQPSAAKLEQLRADRAVVVQLRAEIEKLSGSLQSRERAVVTGRDVRAGPK